MSQTQEQIKAVVDSGIIRILPDCPQAAKRQGKRVSVVAARHHVIALIAEAFCDTEEDPLTARRTPDRDVLVLIRAITLQPQHWDAEATEAVFDLAFNIAETFPGFHTNKVQAAWDWLRYVERGLNV